MKVKDGQMQQLTTEQLLAVIKAASEELATRTAPVRVSVGEHSKATRDSEPTAEEKEFLHDTRLALENGDVMVAADRHRVAEIADRHEAYVIKLRLPTVSTNSDWRLAQHKALLRAADKRK